MGQYRAQQTGPTTFDLGIYSAGLEKARDAARRATPEQLAALTDDERALLIEQGVLLPSRSLDGSLLSMLAQAPSVTAQTPAAMPLMRPVPSHGPEPEPQADWTRAAISMGLRTVPAILGGAVGAFGGPPGLAAGGAIGSSLGELLGQKYDRPDAPVNPWGIGVAGALGAVPGMGAGRAVTRLGLNAAEAALPQVTSALADNAVRRTLQAAGTGLLMAPPSTVATNWAEGRPLTENLALNTAMGGAFGAGTGGAIEAGRVAAPYVARGVQQAGDTLNDLMAQHPQLARRLADETGAVGRLGLPDRLQTLEALDKPTRERVVAEIVGAFPARDAYTKPTAFVSGPVMRTRAATLSSEAAAVVSEIADAAAGARLAPAQVHALVQGKRYKPTRVVRRFNQPPADPTAKPIVGAPRDVYTRAHERARLRSYLGLVEDGVEGADWYDESGADILFYANDDPTRAMAVSDAEAATSSGTGVDVNTGFAIKGHNQVMANEPVRTGRFPTAMSKKIYQSYTGGGASGPKHEPFSHNLAQGGGYLPKVKGVPRSVHDIWDGEAWGFMNPDGSPLRRGFTKQEHAWMDNMADEAVAQANARQLGGRTDWTLGRLQAAAWVGSKKRAGDRNPAFNVRDAFRKYVMAGSRETVPGKNTGHLQGMTPSEAGTLHDLIRTQTSIYDARMRDQIAAKFGLLTGEAFEAPGVYQGVISPGIQTQSLVGQVDAPEGGRMVDPASMKLMQAVEATYGLLTAQKAIAGSRLVKGVGGSKHAAEVAWGRVPTDAEMQRLDQLVKKYGGNADSVALVATRDGVRLINTPTAWGGLPPKVFDKLVKQAKRDFNATHVERNRTMYDHGNGVTEDRGGFYKENPWDTPEGAAGQAFARLIPPDLRDRFDAVAPAIAAQLNAIDQEMVRLSGGRLHVNQAITALRDAVAADGYAGVERLAKQLGAPLALLMSLAGALQQVGLLAEDTDRSAAGVAPASLSRAGQ